MENGSDGPEPPDTDVTPRENGPDEEDKENEEDSSDCDALVIDEKRSAEEAAVEELPHSNPYFSESLFELSQRVNNGENKRKTYDRKGRLREYAQYLGLQPTVQFKCSKCGRAGFPSLVTLNEHHVRCTGDGPPISSAPITAPSMNFRVTRKVFLCSACGTYYENWNLFLHMREVHKRFICLYCLGMFSHPEKLSQHLVAKHSCVPGYRDSAEDFFHLYKEPCFLMCCECEKVFSEQDNFFSHPCTQKKADPKNGKLKVKAKQGKMQVEHVTADVPSTSEKIEEGEPENVQQNSCIPKATDVTEQELKMSDAENTTPDVPKEEVEPHSNTENPPETEANTEPEPEPEPIENSITPELHNNNSLASSSYSEENPPCSDVEDTRKVPKVTLKLPKPGSYVSPQEDSDDSDKLTMEVDQPENNVCEEEPEVQQEQPAEPQIQVAGADVSIVELELEQPLDKFDIRVLLQKCLKATVPTCIYCNHARKIAVNGKQLGLHAIAEHRFSAVVNSITAEELIPESFVTRIKEGLPELENVFFNLESSSSEEAVTFSHVFECFQCRFSTTVHKELYLHNRKSHAKTILLCIMCKSVFYSYSELICHLCPGLYALENEVRFRCCMCISKDLPSAFRLLVHLRKRHHACDVCLELCHNQARLSSHVWKHKLHHFCYRCGIAYRNKPDITKHLFWKHGTESVVCKKCLQKKWPHVYHFCIPPTSFTCEECNLSFTRAVSLKVHKRIHADEKPHMCTIDGCSEKFISKKLLLKHEFKHREPQEQAQNKDSAMDSSESNNAPVADAEEAPEEKETVDTSEEKPVEKPKPKVDVYDLPELNLSESDSSDSENETPASKPAEEKSEEASKEKEEEKGDDKVVESTVELPDECEKDSKLETTENVVNEESDTQEKPAPILDVWDDFKNYQANKGKLETILTDVEKTNEENTSENQIDEPMETLLNLVEIIRKEHDYCEMEMDEEPTPKDTIIEIPPENMETVPSLDHDYCSPSNPKNCPAEEDPKLAPQKQVKEQKVSKKQGSSSSDSSSDSDSSSCTCGSNCSCSSSSGSSSSSSDSSDSDSSTSEGRRRQQARRERRKEKGKANKEKESETVDVVATDKTNVAVNVETLIEESDLETTESETDEDFYDEHPLRLAKSLAEKRSQLLNDVGSTINGSLVESSRPSTPSLPEEAKPKKKSKSKKRKKKKSAKHSENIPTNSYDDHTPLIAPLTLSIPRDSPVSVPPASLTPSVSNLDDSDPNVRSSKRRRVPNKFYGYSSDEDQDKPQAKWRKAEAPPQQLVPPITIKTVAPAKPIDMRFLHVGIKM